MNGQSPYASPPGAEYYYDKAQFATPTPSPRGPAVFYYASTPQRPHTRAHVRHASTGVKDYHDYPSPRAAAFSPRYNSEGLYSTNAATAAAAAATANVSATRSSRKKSFSGPRPTRERRCSHSQYRPSDHYGESDEDEFVEINGVTYKLSPIKPISKRSTRRYAEEDDAAEDEANFYYYHYQTEGRATDHRTTTQTASRRYDDFDRRETRYYEEPRRPSHARRASHSMPQRPQTVRPTSAYYHQPPPPQQQHHHHSHRAPPPVVHKATEADAKKWGIPKGYALKNWDPTEEPILLLGSVFDANSLGKWIYDWTVYSRGSSTAFSDMAGALWLLLIELSHKIKRGKETVPLIRARENVEMIEDFIESGQRITDRLKKLLKLCEKPMLTAASSGKNDAQLGQRSGIEFVETLFGRDRELERTEAFMQSVRVFNLRFEANCEEIILHPEQ
ncbi:hypothetical protein BD289DRAFT_57198 [Coniella lustricola]|uniref:Vegetative cell wall protein gp1 n=1 Tax=Coniella lustricola TaxID=2025994 RepID=A0A2T3AIA1_9PEZI|nr:hypothetical protein BD289DRAFT_57198 [Coniella lustricola]